MNKRSNKEKSSFIKVFISVYAQVAQAVWLRSTWHCVMALLYKEFVWEIHRSYGIVQNKGENSKIDSPFLVVCITSVSMAFGGVLERF